MSIGGALQGCASARCATFLFLLETRDVSSSILFCISPISTVDSTPGYFIHGLRATGRYIGVAHVYEIAKPTLKPYYEALDLCVGPNCHHQIKCVVEITPRFTRPGPNERAFIP